LALGLVATLITVEKQLREYRAAIQQLFEQHPDKDLFGSLPGTGPKLAPRLLSELEAIGAFLKSAQSLQCLAGTAPVTFQSVRSSKSISAAAAIKTCANPFTSGPILAERVPWAQQYYQAHRDKGQSMRAPCVAWDKDGSRSSGKCGKPARPTTRTCTLATSKNTVPGCLH